MKDLWRVATPSRRYQYWHCCCEIEAAVEVISERDVMEINVVDYLCSLFFTLFLFLSAYEVPMGALFAEANRELPSVFAKNFSIPMRLSAASTLHADHGRTLSCGHSTLCPRMA